MLLIVLHHMCRYGYVGDAGLATDMLKNILSLGGKIGVDVFVLISGYFLASGRIKTTSFLRVLIEALFYSAALGLICALAFPATFDLKVFFKSFLPANGGLPWFVTAYLGMYLVSPWLSRLAATLERSAFRLMLLIGFCIFSVVNTLPGCAFVTNNFSWFCYLYLVACYIRLFGLSNVLAKRMFFGGGVLPCRVGCRHGAAVA